MNQNQKERLAYSRNEVAQSLGVSLSFVNREIADGNLKVIRRRGRVIIPAESVRAYLSGESKTQDQAEVSQASA